VGRLERVLKLRGELEELLRDPRVLEALLADPEYRYKILAIAGLLRIDLPISVAPRGLEATPRGGRRAVSPGAP